MSTRPQRRDRLCGLLWDLPDDPRGALRWSLSKLRPLVDDAESVRLQADRDQVWFEATDCHVDWRDLVAAADDRFENASPTQLASWSRALEAGLLPSLDLPDCREYQAWLTAMRTEGDSLRVRLREAGADAAAKPAAAAPAPPDRPAIAVLPFENMSGDPEQEYFSDGITEDIITALAKYRWIGVIARNSTFGYKGKAQDVRRVAADLGAAYVVEGSVRRAGQRLRVTAQLIDGASGNHLWAERYDRDLADVFALQDEITDTVVARIEPEVGAAERLKVARAPRADLRAWDAYHLGIWHFFKFTATDNKAAVRHLEHSMALDPDFAAAHGWWAYALLMDMVYWDTDPDRALLDKALAATERALEIDDQNAAFYFLKARVQLARRAYADAQTEAKIATTLNPTFCAAYCGLGDALAYEGRYDEAMPQFERALTLSPNDPQRWAFFSYGALAALFKRDFERALDWSRQANEIPNRQYWTTAHMTVALAHLGRLEEAQAAVARLQRERPGFTIAFARKKLFYIDRPEQISLYLDGLRTAGVPED